MSETLQVLRLCALSLNPRSVAPLVQLKVALATATRTAIEMQPSCQEERGPGLSWLCGGNHCATLPLQSSGKSDLSFTECSKHGTRIRRLVQLPDIHCAHHDVFSFLA